MEECFLTSFVVVAAVSADDNLSIINLRNYKLRIAIYFYDIITITIFDKPFKCSYQGSIIGDAIGGRGGTRLRSLDRKIHIIKDLLHS